MKRNGEGENVDDNAAQIGTQLRRAADEWRSRPASTRRYFPLLEAERASRVERSTRSTATGAKGRH